MTVIRYEYGKSDGLERELAHMKNNMEKVIRSYQSMSVNEFLSDYFQWKSGVELADSARLLLPGSSILDIGAGFGQSTVYFLKQGLMVTALEPSPEACACIDTMAKKTGAEIDIHACAMENFETERRFDACVFNASLHHCDDPLSALKKCYAFLKPGGRVFLVNEQVLKFYRSKKWWLWMLENKPEKVGHYGGNEHIYRYKEYAAMVSAAGFRITEKIPVYYRDPRSICVTILLMKGQSGKYVYSDMQIAARFIWYFFASRLMGNGAFLRLCKELSLISTTMIGEKPSSP